MATLLKYKKGLKRPTLAWNEFAIRYSDIRSLFALSSLPAAEKLHVIV